MNIQVNNLTYRLPDQSTLFSGISFSIGNGSKCAVIGNNGTGKSTLLNIISGKLCPSAGDIQCADTYLVPQHFGQFDGMSVAECLHIDDKIRAMRAVLSGNASYDDYETLQDDWTLEERVATAFRKWDIPHISPDSPMTCLSGGEKTKVFLSGIDIHEPSVVLMDEPTNHLDRESREKLYRYIFESKSTVLVVSHDRELLNRFDSLLHLGRHGIRYYPMNYAGFQKIYQQECEALLKNIDAKQQDLAKAKRQARESAERQQKRSSRGAGLSDTKCLPRISKGNLKNRSETTSAALNKVQNERIMTINHDIDELKSLVPDEALMKIDFSSPALHAGKTLVELRSVNFSYTGSGMLWQENLNITIRSGDRIRITGKNGCGKTTFLKLITGRLHPVAGTIYSSDCLSYAYLDQEYSFINNDMTVFEQLASQSSTMPEHELKIRLHRFLFPQQTWNNKCQTLSGGEKMRLAICSLMVRDAVPDVIIVDEPTNNIDIANMDILAHTLRLFKGTLIAISHDDAFISDIDIKSVYRLGNNCNEYYHKIT